MKIEDIKKLPIRNLTQDNCVLFLWSTTPMLDVALEVLKCWGFKYKTALTWEKTNRDCLGYYFKICTEHLLVGIKGKVKAFRTMQRSLYSSPRIRHSEKPQFFRDLITSLNFIPKIELFARQKTDGWDVWGNEVESDIEL